MKVKCVRSSPDEGGRYLAITVGEIYEVYGEENVSSINDDFLLIWDDEGDIFNYRKEVFEIMEEEV